MISISGLQIWKLAYTTSHQVIIYTESILLYNEPKIDIWNINANINISYFDTVVIEYNQDELT